MDTLYPSISYDRFEPEPVAAERVRVTAYGRAYIQQVVDYTDARLTLEHTWISANERDQLWQLYADNKGNWIGFDDPGGRHHQVQFIAPPKDYYLSGPYWGVTCELILRRIVE